ncbi:hypothetical protein L6452_08923 [Arctium lappa]|uniref:Uncharacterized protein n=1 Tax=Arctium lappa TaxID=4217 RepID=A0ACB9DIL5_ARCLA|nr:hypothetical protein L6452_08923 [Arctium lappa]
MVEHSPSMSHVSPVHTATTPPTTGDAQDDDEEVDMTRVEDISPPKRIRRQGAQSMAQAEGSNRAVLQKSPSTSRGSKVEEMKNTILGEVQKATTKLKKTFKARTNKLKGKINGLQAEVNALKEERVKWLEYRREKDRVKKRE